VRVGFALWDCRRPATSIVSACVYAGFLHATKDTMLLREKFVNSKSAKKRDFHRFFRISHNFSGNSTRYADAKAAAHNFAPDF
jgi:hypothetical protein